MGRKVLAFASRRQPGSPATGYYISPIPPGSSAMQSFHESSEFDRTDHPSFWNTGTSELQDGNLGNLPDDLFSLASTIPPGEFSNEFDVGILAGAAAESVCAICLGKCYNESNSDLSSKLSRRDDE